MDELTRAATEQMQQQELDLQDAASQVGAGSIDILGGPAEGVPAELHAEMALCLGPLDSSVTMQPHIQIGNTDGSTT